MYRYGTSTVVGTCIDAIAGVGTGTCICTRTCPHTCRVITWTCVGGSNHMTMKFISTRIGISYKQGVTGWV